MTLSDTQTKQCQNKGGRCTQMRNGQNLPRLPHFGEDDISTRLRRMSSEAVCIFNCNMMTNHPPKVKASNCQKYTWKGLCSFSMFKQAFALQNVMRLQEPDFRQRCSHDLFQPLLSLLSLMTLVLVIIVLCILIKFVNTNRQKITRYNEYQQEIDTKEDKIMNLQSCVAFGRAI